MMELIIIFHIALCLAVKMYGSTLEGDSARSSNKNGFQLADRGETYSHSRQQDGYYHKPQTKPEDGTDQNQISTFSSSEIKIVLQPELIKI